MKVTNQYVYLDRIPTEKAILCIQSPKLVTGYTTDKAQTDIVPGQRRYSLPPGLKKKDIKKVWVDESSNDTSGEH